MLIINTIFRSGMKITQVPISWFRAVSGFLANFAPGTGVRIRIPASPDMNNPVLISIDEAYIKGLLNGVVTEDELNRRLRDYGNDDAAGGCALTPAEDPTNVDTSKTNDGGVEGIEDTTRAAVSGESLAQAAAAVTAEQGGTWTAGGDDGLVAYEIARIKPFMVSTAKYGKVFLRKKVYNHNGQLASQGPEIDQNILIRLY